MTDPVLTFVILVFFFAAIAAARYFKTLDTGFGQAAASPIVCGIASGVVIFVASRFTSLHTVVAGIVVTLAAMYVRHTGDESEAPEGMLLGALIGASAALPLAFSGENELRHFSECAIAGTIAGYGVTFAQFHVTDRARQLLIDLVTAVAAVAGGSLPKVVERAGFRQRPVAIFVAVGVPLLSAATVFARWRSVRSELAHEAAIGVIDADEVRTTAHPILRFTRAGWSDAAAHREFVRLANRIALRKRQQRNRPDDTARLYQLEIIKLRMQLKEMTSIDRATVQRDDELP
ncbi:MAG TPA: hypothetical protein VH087_15230 [Thermoanaerobaculia bacterium]|jgi:hypothetical protein|nr:hypothetical protein [Thermoanaerobaculia bacterium]